MGISIKSLTISIKSLTILIKSLTSLLIDLVRFLMVRTPKFVMGYPHVQIPNVYRLPIAVSKPGQKSERRQSWQIDFRRRSLTFCQWRTVDMTTHGDYQFLGKWEMCAGIFKESAAAEIYTKKGKNY